MDKIIVLTSNIGIDSVGRIVNTLRRGKVKLKEIKMNFEDNLVKIYIKLSGEENEIDWLSKKLNRLVDVEEIKVLENG
jgi:hypothetical protein